jgi:hypothetical protein
LVAKVVAVVFVSQGREPPEGVGRVWKLILDDLSDGPDVLEVTSQVMRANQYVTAGDIHRAVVAERKRRGVQRALLPGGGRPRECPKCGGTGWMETTSHRPPYRFVARCVCEPTEVHYASRETTRFWITKIRQQLDQANGPLARSLRPMLTVPQADERYFADHHDPDPVEQWYGDDPEDRS